MKNADSYLIYFIGSCHTSRIFPMEKEEDIAYAPVTLLLSLWERVDVVGEDLKLKSKPTTRVSLIAYLHTSLQISWFTNFLRLYPRNTAEPN